jgi:hypothetical protein
MRRVVIVGIAAGLAVLAGFYLIALRTSASANLSARMQLGAGTTVDFAEIAPFTWDRVYFFGPDTSHETIDDALGFHWGDAKKTSIQFNKDRALVLFVRNQEVVYWFEHPRTEDLAGLANLAGYARHDATFVVHSAAERGRLMLVKEN